MRTNKPIKTFYQGILALLLLFSATLSAQNTKTLSLQEAIDKALENNLTIKISDKDNAISKAVYKQTMAVFLPRVTVSSTTSFTNNPMNNFGFKLLQQSTTVADFNPDVLNNPTEIRNFNTSIQLEQPLLNFDAFHQRKAVKAQVEASKYNLERAKEGIALKVNIAYMQLQLSYKAVIVLEKSLKTIATHKTVADNLFKQGLIQKADVLNVAVHVAAVQNQLQISRSNIKNSSNYLSYLLGSNDTGIIKPSKKLDIAIADDFITANINTGRNDFLAIKANINAQEQMLKASKKSFLPRANAFSNYEWNSNTILDLNANNYFVGVQLSWSLFNGGKNINKIVQEKKTLDKAQLGYKDYVAQSSLEITKTKRQLTDAKNNLKRSKIAVAQSKEALRIRTNRFEQGLEKTSDLLTSETQYQANELDYYQAIFNYNYTLVYLNFLLK